MNENILTKQEIQRALAYAAISPELRQDNIVGQCVERTDVLKISPKSGVIFILGDLYTGFTHLNERHGFSTNKTFWTGDGKIDTPSRFGKGAIPITHYIRIADVLYMPENKKNEKNKYPDLFDIYEAKVDDPDMGSEEYRLILYKDTPIIHTLFPLSDKSKKKKYINLRRGKPQGNMTLEPLQTIMGIPYWNGSNEVEYSFVLDKNYETMEEKGIFVDNKLNKQIILYTRTIEKFEKIEDTANGLLNADMSEFEKYIRRVENYKKEK